MLADPYIIPLEIILSPSNAKEATIANKPNRKQITAAIMFKPSSKISILPIAAKIIIKEPPNNKSIDRINWSQIYLLNKLFI